MDLIHLIKNYHYLQFFVDVYEEYKKEYGEHEDDLVQEIEQKYEAAKAFLSCRNGSTSIKSIPGFGKSGIVTT